MTKQSHQIIQGTFTTEQKLWKIKSMTIYTLADKDYHSTSLTGT